MKENLVEKVKTVTQNHLLLRRGDSVLIAVSGGADSVCLLDILVSLKEAFSLTLYAAHVNHMLRDNESNRDEAFVQLLCDRYHIPLFSKRIDVKRLAQEKKCSLEEAGRAARYAFFRDLQKEHAITKIATAHNKNDNVETVLMRFMRGTGIKGLSGIPIQNEFGVIRPLLYTSRAEIEAHLAKRKLEYVTDSSNFSDDYTRNKVRNHLIPYIREHHNTSFVDTLCDNIEVYTEAEHFLEHCTKDTFHKIVTEEEYGLSVKLDALLLEDKCLAKRIIQKAIKKLSLFEAANKTVQAIYNMAKVGEKQSVCINQSLTAYVAYGALYFVKKKEALPFSFPLDNTQALAQKGYLFSFEKGMGNFHFSDKNTIYIKDRILPEQLTLRSRQPGDRIFLGNCGHKKVKDLLIDEKIPSFLRDDIPVLLFENEIIWVCGIRDNPLFRPKPGDAYIKISYQKEKNHA